MKRAFVTFFIIGAFMAANGGNSFAQTKAPGKGEQSMEEKGSPARPDDKMEQKGTSKQAGKRATGEVTSVDAKAGKLAVKTKDKELDLDAKGTAAKKSLENIHVGDRVTVSYSEKGGNLVAQSITKAGASKSKESSKNKKTN
jgi:Cu/Ag efflux protein CusF